jgi:hypothetical protein
VLKRYQLAPDCVSEIHLKMATVLERAKGFAHPHVVLPSEILPPNGNELVTVSRFVPGLPLNELLVRRGRFPAAVVFEIGRQLLDGLAALHKKSIVHGDIRMSNVRLTDTGLVVLVDGGVRPAVHPEITIHDTLALEAYDGIAPELIGTGESPNASSELYAVGCLLWQLLAGRPPFPTADPLAKLASHQTRIIDDVRLWAPDTPPILAKTIQQMTSSSPDQRPRSCNEVLQRWGKPGSFSRSRLKQFRRLFEGEVPHFAGPVARDKTTSGIWLAALIFAVTGMAGLLYDIGLRNELLEIFDKAKTFTRFQPAAASDASGNRPEKAARTAKKNRNLLPLPEPENGVILLKEAGPYEVAKIGDKGDLTIRSAIGVKPEIHVEGTALKLAGFSISLEGITIRCARGHRPDSLVNVMCQQLQIVNCEFRTCFADVDDSDRIDEFVDEILSVTWKPPSTRDSQLESVQITNTCFHGSGAAVYLHQVPGTLRCSNSLKTGQGAFVKLAPKCQATEFVASFDHLTLRQSGALIELAGEPASKNAGMPIDIKLAESIIQLADARNGLIVFAARKPRKDLAKSCRINISNTVVGSGTEPVTRFDPELKLYAALPSLELEEIEEQFQGLVTGEIKFSGLDLNTPSHSKTHHIVGPQADSDVLPGIDANKIGPFHRSD